MAGIENVIKEFEHLLNAAKGNYQDFVDLTVDGGKEILAILKEQQRKISRLTLENNLIRQNCQGLEEQREAFAMKLEEMATEMKKAKEG